MLGTGIWGSTLAQVASERGHRVQRWGRTLGWETLEQQLQGSHLVISAVSMSGVQPLAQALGSLGWTGVLLSATKGLDRETLQTPAQLWRQHLPQAEIAVLSGPNLAQEIRQGLPAAAVVGCAQPELGQQIQTLLSSPRFRLYTHGDPMGVELGGILKNVIAIAAGACDGLHLGTNAKAALITRGLHEMSRFGAGLGARPETFSGLSGLGDLLATCNSSLSRNYQVGYQLAQDASLETALSQIQGTAEGVNTAPVVMKLAAPLGIPMPICEQVDRVIRGESTPQKSLNALVQRDPKPEWGG